MSTGAIQKVAAAIGERFRLIGQLNHAIRMRDKGAPGWDNTIKTLQNQLFGTGSTRKKGQIHGNPGEFKVYTSGPEGSYDFNRDQNDRKRVQQSGLNQILVQKIPVSTLGLVTGYNPFLCDHNGLQVLARTMDDNGNLVESSDTARIFIRFNSTTAPWLPIGFAFSPQSIAKSDNLVFQGYIERFWVYVQQVTQDATFQPNLVVALLRSVALFGPGGGSNLYGSPSTNSNTAPTESAIDSSGGGGGGGQQGGGAPGGGGVQGGGGGGGHQGGGGQQNK